MRLLCYLLVILMFMAFSCGDLGKVPENGIQGGGVSSSAGLTGQADSVSLTATPSALSVNGTSGISATVVDSSGAIMSDGTVVSFTLSTVLLGTINAQATTSNGIATATFTASTTPGTVTVTATSGNASDTADITITAPGTGSIEFTSASPAIIGISGSGWTTTSFLTFTVNDINGNIVVDGTSVDFIMSGPGGGRLPSAGGEYIGDMNDGTPTTASASTVNGIAGVYINSGSVAGTVDILATVSGTTMQSSAAPISIGGGTPNATHLTLTSDRYNLEGLIWAGIQANLSVYMADRFGNHNVLQGTAVSFQTESGSINTGSTSSSSAVIDAIGFATVVFRTQNPPPASPDHPEGKDVAVLGGGVCAGAPSGWNTYPADWESCLQSYVSATYGISTTRHPRDGWANVIVSTRGEEGFDDTNGNGMYDSGESFTDTFQEPFIDLNDNNVHDDGSTDPFEIYMDDNGDGNYDGLNGSWDSNKIIVQDITLLITGSPAYIRANPSTFAVSNGGAQSFTLLVTDINLNPIIGDSTVSISASVGELTGTTSYTFPDLFIRGPVEIGFTLTDDDSTDTDLPEASDIEILVTHKDLEYPVTITGTVD